MRLVVIMHTGKARGFAFTDFLEIQNAGASGQPNEYSWLCSEHLVSGEKSNNPLAPNYIPTLFSHVESPVKSKMVARLEDFNRRQAMKRRRVENEPSLVLDEVEETQSAVDITTTPCSREVHIQLLHNAHSQELN